MQHPNEDLLEYTNICASLMGASYCLKYWQFLFLVCDIYTLVGLRYRQIIVLYGLLVINLFLQLYKKNYVFGWLMSK